jgi:hypothetical protein
MARRFTLARRAALHLALGASLVLGLLLIYFFAEQGFASLSTAELLGVFGLLILPLATAVAARSDRHRSQQAAPPSRPLGVTAATPGQVSRHPPLQPQVLHHPAHTRPHHHAAHALPHPAPHHQVPHHAAPLVYDIRGVHDHPGAPTIPHGRP